MCINYLCDAVLRSLVCVAEVRSPSSDPIGHTSRLMRLFPSDGSFSMRPSGPRPPDAPIGANSSVVEDQVVGRPRRPIGMPPPYDPLPDSVSKLPCAVAALELDCPMPAMGRGRGIFGGNFSGSLGANLEGVGMALSTPSLDVAKPMSAGHTALLDVAVVSAASMPTSDVSWSKPAETTRTIFGFSKGRFNKKIWAALKHDT